MTFEDAIKILEYPVRKWLMDTDERDDGLSYVDALDMAINALRIQKQREQLWHDAKTDPPEMPGLYYGAKDDTNIMYAVNYRNGVWTSACSGQKLDIIRWAYYTAFDCDG